MGWGSGCTCSSWHGRLVRYLWIIWSLNRVLEPFADFSLLKWLQARPFRILASEAVGWVAGVWSQGAGLVTDFEAELDFPQQGTIAGQGGLG